jgi:hypothetical protein
VLHRSPTASRIARLNLFSANFSGPIDHGRTLRRCDYRLLVLETGHVLEVCFPAALVRSTTYFSAASRGGKLIDAPAAGVVCVFMLFPVPLVFFMDKSWVIHHITP